MNLNTIKKYVINLKRRPERLRQIDKEMQYMGWEYELFEAIDTNSYIGCILSHKAIAQKFLESNEESVMVLEDDAFFMPYAKELVKKLNVSLTEIQWQIINLGPSINRPVDKTTNNLLDISNLPPCDKDKHRGIYGTVGLLYGRNVAKQIVEFYEENKRENYILPIDQFLDEHVYPKGNCYSPYIPLITQRPAFSDINQTQDNNHYVITYNWNGYTGHKLPNNYMDFNFCDGERK